MTFVLNQAISAYRQASTTVPPLSAVTLLFDEVLNAIVLAAQHTQAGEFEDACNRTHRAIGILQALRQNIDTTADPALAQQLITMYSTNIRALMAVIGKRDAIDRYAKLAKGLLELRNAWADMTNLSQRKIEPILRTIYAEEFVANVG